MILRTRGHSLLTRYDRSDPGDACPIKLHFLKQDRGQEWIGVVVRLHDDCAWRCVFFRKTSIALRTLRIGLKLNQSSTVLGTDRGTEKCKASG